MFFYLALGIAECVVIVILFLSAITTGFIAPGAVTFAFVLVWIQLAFAAFGVVSFLVSDSVRRSTAGQPYATHTKLITKWIVIVLLVANIAGGWLVFATVMVTCITHALIPEIQKFQRGY